MEGTAQIRIASRSVFGGVEDVIRMEGTATVEKTDYGWPPAVRGCELRG